MKFDRKTVFSGFLWVFLHKSWSLSTSKHTKWLKQESWFENQRTWSHIDQFSFCFGGRMLTAKWWIHVFYGFSEFECQKLWDCMQEGGRKNCITVVYPVLIHWWVVDAILLLCWSTACFITLLSFTQQFYIAELYLILLHCRGIPYLITWLSNSQILIHCWAIPNPKTC